MSITISLKHTSFLLLQVHQTNHLIHFLALASASGILSGRNAVALDWVVILTINVTHQQETAMNVNRWTWKINIYMHVEVLLVFYGWELNINLSKGYVTAVSSSELLVKLLTIFIEFGWSCDWYKNGKCWRSVAMAADLVMLT
jgi:hypothetical protein